MDNNENTIFDSTESKRELLMKLLNWYLVTNEDFSAKEENKLFNLNLSKTLLSSVDIDKIVLKEDLIVLTPKAETILHPFAVLLQQLSDALLLIEEAEEIAKIVIPYLGEDIRGQGSETQSQKEARLMILMDVPLSEEVRFERMLYWLLEALDPFVSNPEFIETLRELFEDLNGRMKFRLSKFHEVPRTRPLPGAGNGGVMEKAKAKTIPWQKRDSIHKAYAEFFRRVFLLYLILYVKKVKRAENPDIIE